MKSSAIRTLLSLFVCLSLPLALGAQNSQTTPSGSPRIKLATTTSTEQSGLLAYMLPVFEQKTGYKVDVIAVGTGASLKIAQNGDCDVVLVHARSLEDAFMAAGWGIERRDVMYNDFIILGPKSDPAGIRTLKNSKDSFSSLAAKKAVFVSRGDNSGTHVKEKDLWKLAGIVPSGAWYKEAGQGMSQVIIMAEQLGGYTLSDRATWLAVKNSAPRLSILFEGDKELLNPYGIIAVNPGKWPHVNAQGSKALMDFFTNAEGRALIESFKIGGDQCFFLL
ncbi:MAG: tungstate transport system substrate-binding protein [Spirochaetes bacterium]|nr:MAG: tungstate transport system substrate-binding protein [Spirochaetota bacterium]